MADEPKPAGFVSLKSVVGGKPDATTALAEIRQIYFKTSRRTIDNDFIHAVELLKSLPDEDSRARAHVYMEGLAEMAREWGPRKSERIDKLTPRNVRKERRSSERPKR